MTSAFVAPLKPTWSRLLRLTVSGTSILRELEYEKLATLSFKGHTLDFGGGKKADYLPRLNIEGTLESLNISEKMEPTFIADANQTWPMEEARYDNILSMNTLEHIYRDIHAVQEALRVLKPGGTFTFAVPYLFRVHASPSDYHRHTHFAWRDIFIELGIPEENIQIEALVWDPIASAFLIFEHRVLRALRPLVLLIGLLRAKAAPDNPQRLCKTQAENWSTAASGYFITVRKPH